MKRRNESIINQNKPSGSYCKSTAVVRFPYGKLFGWLLLLLIGGMFVYRLSETGGKSTEIACLWAMGISVSAALAGLVSVYKVWGRALMWVLLGVFLSGAIRLLIGAVGVVIIIAFTATDKMSFVGFLALFYVVFLAMDTWLALWVLRNTKIEDENKTMAIHGNVWDIVGKYRSAQ